MNERIILASGSPRRKELLSLLVGDSFEIIPARGEEDKDPSLSPSDLVKSLSEAKAREIALQYPEAVVIGADTIVVSPDGEIMGKPADEADAFRMLSELSGKDHMVYTGICVYKNGKPLQDAVGTAVTFREMTDEEIRKYISTGEPMDKAGAYGIQGLAAPYISGINGDYYTVVGLPLCALGTLLKRAGVSI